MDDDQSQIRQPIAFEYWSDPLCIWAFVSEPRLQGVLRDRAELLRVTHRLVVVFGSVPWRFREGPWVEPGPAGRAVATRTIAQRFGRDDVTGQVWTDDAPASSWAPAAAIKAAFAQEAAQESATGSAEAYQCALRDAFFVDNRNIARRRVQLEVAEALGLRVADLEQRLDDGAALAAVWEDQRRKDERYIQGSPTYVFDDGRALLYGNVAPGILEHTVDELLRGLNPGGSRC